MGRPCASASTNTPRITLPDRRQREDGCGRVAARQRGLLKRAVHADTRRKGQRAAIARRTRAHRPHRRVTDEIQRDIGQPGRGCDEGVDAFRGGSSSNAEDPVGCASHAAGSRAVAPGRDDDDPRRSIPPATSSSANARLTAMTRSARRASLNAPSRMCHNRQRPLIPRARCRKGAGGQRCGDRVDQHERRAQLAETRRRLFESCRTTVVTERRSFAEPRACAGL